jgi:hypothetical protein
MAQRYGQASDIDGFFCWSRFVVFGRFRHEERLIIASQTKVICWSLLDFRPTWTVTLNVQQVFADPASPYIAILTKESKSELLNWFRVVTVNQAYLTLLENLTKFKEIHKNRLFCYC